LPFDPRLSGAGDVAIVDARSCIAIRPMIDFAPRRAAFRRLHESGCFIIPNPWDVGSARWLEGLGFKALASTSSGFAWSQGKHDGAMACDDVLAHLRQLCTATNLPVNADFEHGFADDLEGLARNVAACVATGVAGLSIEDSTGDRARPLFDLGEAVERIAAARAAIDAAGEDVMLIGRAECHLVGHPDPLAESIRRLRAYADAGADCLYAPGLPDRDAIRAVVEAVAPKPVNVLVGAPMGLARDDLAELGVRRISLGGALARAAWGGFMRASRELVEGRFDVLADAAQNGDLNRFFAAGRR
jgi:2-methylisocitrate lyase-like PEP mutase family enzyme